MSDEMENVDADEQMIDCKCPYCGESVSFPKMDALAAQDCPFCMQVLVVPKDSGGVAKKFPLPITTSRLILRRLQPGDADALMQLTGDDDAEVAQRLQADEKVILSQLSPKLQLAVALRDTDRVIGLATMKYGAGPYEPAFNHPPEFTIMIGEPDQRKGFGAEAVRGLLEFGFRGLNMHRIIAYCDSRNEAFMKLAVKVGLRQEGAFFEDRFVKGEWVNTAYYAILQSEFEAAAGQKVS